jgi:hypothetical protein
MAKLHCAHPLNTDQKKCPLDSDIEKITLECNSDCEWLKEKSFKNKKVLTPDEMKSFRHDTIINRIESNPRIAVNSVCAVASDYGRKNKNS